MGSFIHDVKEITDLESSISLPGNFMRVGQGREP